MTFKFFKYTYKVYNIIYGMNQLKKPYGTKYFLFIILLGFKDIFNLNKINFVLPAETKATRMKNLICKRWRNK